MKIVICGAGRVGCSIAQYLSRQQNDVVLLDVDARQLVNIGDIADVKTILGDGSEPESLSEAEADSADMLIAVTSSDQVNMVCCQMAHSLFNIPMKIARLRTDSYNNPRWAKIFGHDHVPIDIVISPAHTIVDAIHDRLDAPGAFDVVPLVGDRVRVVGTRCAEDCPLVYQPLRQLTTLFPDLKLTILLITHQGMPLIPKADDVLSPHDSVYFAVETGHMMRALQAFGHEYRPSKSVLIVGGGNMGLILGQKIRQTSLASHTTLVERNQLRARKIAEALPEATVIQGDIMETETLESLRPEVFDTVVSLTDDDEVNALSVLMLKKRGVLRGISVISKGIYTSLVSEMGLDVIVNPPLITVATILRHVRHGRIQAVYPIHEGFAELFEATALSTSNIIGTPLKDFKIKSGIIIGAIVRGGEVIIPRPDTVVEEDDRIVILAEQRLTRRVEQLFSVSLDYF